MDAPTFIDAAMAAFKERLVASIDRMERAGNAHLFCEAEREVFGLTIELASEFTRRVLQHVSDDAERRKEANERIRAIADAKGIEVRAQRHRVTLVRTISGTTVKVKMPYFTAAPRGWGWFKEVECAYERARDQRKVVLTDEDRRRILELSRDLPRVWRAASTSNQQRKNLLRILVRRDADPHRRAAEDNPRAGPLGIGRHHRVLHKASPPRQWYTGRRGYGRPPPLPRGAGPPRRRRRRHPQPRGHEDGNGQALGRPCRGARALPPPGGSTGLVPGQQGAPDQRSDGLYSSRGVAARFGVRPRTVSRWVQTGLLQIADGGTRREPAWFELDPVTVDRLEAYMTKVSKLRGGGAS